MKKSLAGSVLFNALMIGIASAASKGVHFQKPLSATFDYAALNNTINQIMQVLVAAIIVLVLVLIQGVFFFIKDLTRRRGD